MPDYPNDDNGDVLRRLQAKGDDLTKPRNIDFTVVFPTADAAEQFSQQYLKDGYPVSVEKADTVKDLPWDVVVVKHMVPSYEDIGDFEANLEAFASPLGGRNDGWGCITQNEFADL